MTKKLPPLELIQELYAEARNLCIQESKSDAWLWERHFAMLIIKECANIALKSGSIHNKSEQAKSESERIYHKIKDYFGIE